jgi:hypothetical protein
MSIWSRRLWRPISIHVSTSRGDGMWYPTYSPARQLHDLGSVNILVLLDCVEISDGALSPIVVLWCAAYGLLVRSGKQHLYILITCERRREYLHARRPLWCVRRPDLVQAQQLAC